MPKPRVRRQRSPRPPRAAVPRRRARRRSGASRAQQKTATRARILAAALTLFQRRGFEATTTQAIARSAGIAEGTVFNYFPTKEDIALHFLEQEVEHAIATVRSDRRLTDAPLEERLFALVQSQLEYLAPHERFIGAAFVQALTPGSPLGPLSERSQELQVRYLSFVQELVNDAIARREIVAAGWWTPQVFWIYYLGVLLYWLHDRSPNKQQTLAFLDRSLALGIGLLRRQPRT
jgi:AcrR family transcriptional regulator